MTINNNNYTQTMTPELCVANKEICPTPTQRMCIQESTTTMLETVQQIEAYINDLEDFLFGTPTPVELRKEATPDCAEAMCSRLAEDVSAINDRLGAINRRLRGV